MGSGSESVEEVVSTRARVVCRIMINLLNGLKGQMWCRKVYTECLMACVWICGKSVN